jgi:uncharacterized protein with HEPN domain
MTDDRAVFRLRDILGAIDDIRGLLDGRKLTDVEQDRVVRAAFERFLEIVSEASRHVPAAMKALHPDIPWRPIADLGNHLRHAYHRTDPEILWNVYLYDLNALEAACRNLLGRADQGA